MTDNPWEKFLDARAEAIDWLTMKGQSDHDIASTLSLTVEQLNAIRNRPRNLTSEYGGNMRCMTSDGRSVNMAEELNRLEKENEP